MAHQRRRPVEKRIKQRHLLAVWNPRWRPDTVEAHLNQFLTLTDGFRRKECDADDVYVWWAKLQSPNRTAPLPHIGEICALDGQCNAEVADDREVQLYVTDYDSLYVCHVGEITADDVREFEDERGHVPAYYFEEDIRVDCWFRLFDIRRIVADDQLAVIDELQKLRNVRHEDRPVSIYGGIVDPPLIVTRPDGARFFEPREREMLTNGTFWAEYDAERVGLGQMERELRENAFGEAAWFALEPATRSFVATAEKVYRDHRHDSSFDFTPVVVEFAKALEVQCNAILRVALRTMPVERRAVNVDGVSLDPITQGPLSLGQLARVIGEEQAVNEELKLRLKNGEWFASSLPPILEEVANVRNPAAHHRRVTREEASVLRNRLIGVGSPADLVTLAGVQLTMGHVGTRFTPRYVMPV